MGLNSDAHSSLAQWTVEEDPLHRPFEFPATKDFGTLVLEHSLVLGRALNIFFKGLAQKSKFC